MEKFLNISLSKAGADSMITPREMLRDYMTVLNILFQNPEASFEDIVSGKGAAEPKIEQSEEKVEAPSRIFNTTDIEF